MKYMVTPLVGMSDLKFGMALADVRARMSGEFRTFDERVHRDGVDLKGVLDAYDGQGICFLYSPEHELEGISLFSPTHPILEGVDMLTLRMSEAIAMLRKVDPTLVVDGDNATSGRFSLGVNGSPDADDDEDALVYNFFFGRADFYP